MVFTLLTLGAIVLAGLIIYWILQPSNRDRRSSSRRTSRPPKRVISLLNGDTATAQRLFETARSRNPGESDQWCWEKVLWDLERDRRW
ncbi:hypothetical protein C7B65_12080 [Phormidesmis priestleyi ULC007]|uniref:Uncharacterized protein n=2 Tax=Phormidesmis priestleyi TaxID=268141 RepID=A0A2T1DFS8_9CYAN|nr:hypothetical protein C7B65_12080 [Phormidesmis priestleyi ULC007]PZO52186.1 MAG: hypothetical protein DCF14_06865 [Phormidesmis priestleyi]